MKRKGDRYSMQTSLIVATLKRLLPIGLNVCAPGEQELITLAKNRFAQVLPIIHILPPVGAAESAGLSITPSSLQNSLWGCASVGFDWCLFQTPLEEAVG